MNEPRVTSATAVFVGSYAYGKNKIVRTAILYQLYDSHQETRGLHLKILADDIEVSSKHLRILVLSYTMVLVVS